MDKKFKMLIEELSSLSLHENIKSLVEATFLMLDATKKDKNVHNIKLEYQFLYFFIETLVARILNDRIPDLKRDDVKQYEFVKNNYNNVKIAIQEANALGFQQAMQKFGKKEIEFYCNIKAVPESKSDKVH